jgi:GTPase SAR1 family protein
MSTDGARDVRTRCQVVVIGDQGTGKSSLIIAVATDSFPEKSPPVLPPTRLPHDFYPDRVPLTIIDTSSRLVLRRGSCGVLRCGCVVVFWSFRVWSSGAGEVSGFGVESWGIMLPGGGEEGIVGEGE